MYFVAKAPKIAIAKLPITSLTWWTPAAILAQPTKTAKTQIGRLHFLLKKYTKAARAAIKTV